jgi:hypothetical protein
MARAKTPAENKIEGQANLTPFKIITGIATYFKRKRFSTLVNTGIPALPIKAPMITICMPPPSILLAEAITNGFSI